MPFAPFVGVNHYGQSVLLGCGLLSLRDYRFLYLASSECISWHAPEAIVTNQCKPIQAAVAEVFLNTRGVAHNEKNQRQFV
ncbi:hypothetical protein L1049_009333 [Liquidambar formosana]|uniref:Protein FAR1-RELATED SEQUENCE n=1 Tax=Liquidambar formosana TaxID=63359 RepID=A0AAP0X9X4_LIQFO